MNRGSSFKKFVLQKKLFFFICLDYERDLFSRQAGQSCDAVSSVWQCL
jgi:hypothetical protein